MPLRAPRFRVPRAVVLLLGAAGCFAPAADLELARGEAGLLGQEVLLALGTSVAGGLDYADRAGLAQEAAMDGWALRSEGCEGYRVLDPTADDGQGQVEVDIDECADASGRAVIEQGVASDDGAPRDGEVPAAGQATVVYEAFHLGSITTDGTMELRDVGEVTALSLDLTTAALDTEVVLVGEGTWGRSPYGVGRSDIVVEGDFVSSTGLDWRISAQHVATERGCGDGLGGEVLLAFANTAGSVAVRIVFDDVCDGCAEVWVDGERRVESCSVLGG